MALLDTLFDPATGMAMPMQPQDQKDKNLQAIVHKAALADLVQGVSQGAYAYDPNEAPWRKAEADKLKAETPNPADVSQFVGFPSLGLNDLPSLPTRPVMDQGQVAGAPYTPAAQPKPPGPWQTQVVDNPQAQPAAPQQAAPVPQAPVPAAAAPAQAPSGPSIMDRLAGLAQGYNQGGLVGGVATAFGGQAPVTVEQQNQTYQALVSKGIDPATAKAAALNPELLKQVLPLAYPPKAPEFQKLEPGATLVSTQIGPDGKPRVMDVTPNAEGDMSGKTPTSRIRLAAAYGLKPNTPEWRAYVLNGKLPDVTPDHKAIGEADSGVLQAKHLIEDLQRAQQMSPNIYSGFGAETRGYAASQLPGSHPAAEATVDYNNLINSSILPALKSTFPGRVTNADLMLMKELQGAASMPAAARDNVLRRGIARAQEILAEKQAQAEALRNGTFYKPGGNPTPVTIAGQANLKQIENEALAAIAHGADPEAVKKRFRELTAGAQ